VRPRSPWQAERPALQQAFLFDRETVPIFSVVSQKRPFLPLPTRIERRARLVSAIARGRRWLEELVSGSVTDVQQIATRQKCSVRQVNMTISLSFLAPDLVRAAVEGRLLRGIGVERLRDAPAEWSRQFEVLGLNPRQLRTMHKKGPFWPKGLPIFPNSQWHWRLQTPLRGTEFMDAETGG
jgi:hypothetical protein